MYPCGGGYENLKFPAVVITETLDDIAGKGGLEH